MRTSAEVESERISLEQDGRWTLPHTLTDDAIEQAAKMAERAHARLLRTIKMLHEMQRTSSRLVIGHADQINVGQQQINVVASDHIS
jgi:hypothetical protein